LITMQQEQIRLLTQLMHERTSGSGDRNKAETK
jgi:hypothetical protein